jgi:Icc protein
MKSSRYTVNKWGGWAILLLVGMGWFAGGGHRAAEAESAAGAAVTDSPGDKPVLTFSVMSDIHIQAWDTESHRRFLEALRDHAAVNPRSKLLVLNGDLTDGNEEDYRMLMELLQKVPHPPVHATMGNHEYYRLWRTPEGGIDTTRLNPDWSSGQAVGLFTRFFVYKKPYHDLWLAGYHFLFLSGEAYRDRVQDVGEDAYLSDAQLAWLEKRLSPSLSDRLKNQRKPVFVFLHQPLPHTLDGTDNERGVVQAERLGAILNKHPEVVFFSGHTHRDLGTTKQVAHPSFTAAGSASVRYVLEKDGLPDPQKSQSLVVEVYRNKVVIRGREHSTRQWISQAKRVPYL